MTKYGVIGTGYFGAELARFMSKVEGAKITAIYDPVNAAPIAKELNCVPLQRWRRFVPILMWIA